MPEEVKVSAMPAVVAGNVLSTDYIQITASGVSSRITIPNLYSALVQHGLPALSALGAEFTGAASDVPIITGGTPNRIALPALYSALVRHGLPVLNEITDIDNVTSIAVMPILDDYFDGGLIPSKIKTSTLGLTTAPAGDIVGGDGASTAVLIVPGVTYNYALEAESEQWFYAEFPGGATIAYHYVMSPSPTDSFGYSETYVGPTYNDLTESPGSVFSPNPWSSGQKSFVRLKHTSDLTGTFTLLAET